MLKSIRSEPKPDQIRALTQAHNILSSKGQRDVDAETDSATRVLDELARLYKSEEPSESTESWKLSKIAEELSEIALRGEEKAEVANRLAEKGFSTRINYEESSSLVTASDLERWASARDAQAKLPQLVRRLIAATADGVEYLSARSGEGVQLPGWDGLSEAKRPTAYVPAGKSAWEMGTSKNPSDKANRDYRKRTEEPGPVEPASTSYIFVTPRRWRDKEDWAERKREEQVWKNVIVYDADDLESWLENAPAVHAWISARLGKDPHEAESLETWWESWSLATQPPFPPSLVLSGRTELAEEVRQSVRDVGTTLAISGDSKEEVTAFLAASLMEEESEPLYELTQALIVRSASAWRRLSVSRPPLVLLPFYENPDVSLATRHGHHVLVPLGRETKASRGLELPRLRRHGIEEALVDAGLPKEEASELATLGRRSLFSLRRTLAISPEVQAPEWSRPENEQDILPAVLAGRWQNDSEGDREAVSTLAGHSYEDTIHRITQWANSSDPPVRRVGKTWMIASKQDAWMLTARSLSSNVLDRFREVAGKVIGYEDPSLDLSPKERMMAPMLGKTRLHSRHLREGLADTLALMAATSDQVELPDGRTGQGEADIVVHDLLEVANNDPSGRKWTEVSDVLPLLAEAAPDVFLKEIDNGLAGEEPVILKLFQDSDDSYSFFNRSSPHSHLLWALENLAWPPEYVGRVALILAQLSRIEPGGQPPNRPENSLKNVLLLWRPGTAATLEQRLQVVDLLRKHEPKVAWPLMLSLIPAGHESASFTHSPKWRDWKPETEGVSYTELFKTIYGLAQRALEDVGTDGSRWIDLVDQVGSLSPDLRQEVTNQLNQIGPECFSDSERLALTSKLQKMVGRHRRCSDADWALPETDLERLENLIPSLEPDDPIARHTWLFEQGTLYSFDEDDRDKRRTALDEAQTEAIGKIYASAGIDGILSWSESFDSATYGPHQIGRSLGTIEIDDSAENKLFKALLSETESHRRLAGAFFSKVAVEYTEGWKAWVQKKLSARADAWSATERAAFLSVLPPDPYTWDLAEELGSETEYLYWQNINRHNVPWKGEAHLRAARKLIQFDRPYAAIEVLGSHSEDLSEGPPLELIADALEQAIQSQPPAHLDINMFKHYLDQHLKRLENEGFEEERLAQLEWAYLPFYHFEERTSSVLHRNLAEDPSFFVEVVSLVYKPETEEESGEETLSEEEQAQAEIARDLLESWQIVPGTRENDSIDSEKLMGWVHQARSLLEESDRLEIGDHRIGQVLRYGPDPQEDNWPVEAIRDLIEEVASDALDSGLRMEIYSSRGVTRRGLTEGGYQERQLANQYRKWSQEVSISWPRTAALLKRVAESFERDARRHDLDADLTEDLWK